MTIKLNNLSKWQELPADKSLFLRGGAEAVRRITVHFNTDAPTRIVAREYGVEYFLGRIDGKDSVEFSAEGEVEVAAEGDGSVWYWTDDGDVHAFEHAEGSRLFVKPMTRETRSPEMEVMARKIQERNDRRFEIQAAANQRLFDQLAAEREARVKLEAEQRLGDTSATGEPDASPAGDAGDPAPVGAGDGKPKTPA